MQSRGLVLSSCVVLGLILGGFASAQVPAIPSTPDFYQVESSPRITQLRQQLVAGNQNALSLFWQSAKRTGTPLIDTVSGGPHEVIVTFLWKGSPDTESVDLLAPLQKVPHMAHIPLSRLLNTDVWYQAWRVRDDLRFGYRFDVRTKAANSNNGSSVTDPLNAHTLEVSLGEEKPTIEFSVAAMPRAQEPACVTKHAGAPSGEIERYPFTSKILGNQRAVWIYTPAGYSDAGGPYALLVLFDGFEYQNWIAAPTTLDNLIHSGKLPPTIAVFIGNAPGSRMEELGYNSKFADFVAKELVPWIRERWKVTRDPGNAILGGYSAGGGAAAFVAMLHPELFGNVLSQSGDFQVGNKDVKAEWLAQQYRSNAKLPINFFIEAGRLEDISVEGPSLLAANRDFVSVLRQKGYSVSYKEVGGTHEPVHWRGEFPEGLLELSGTEHHQR